jgi:16S rRNA processing protein RimM
MEVSDLISIGTIKKSIGNSGFVAVIPDTDFPKHFLGLKEIFLVFPDNTVKFKKIESARIKNKMIELKLEHIDNKSSADKLRNARIMIEEEDLVSLPDNQIYEFQIPGCAVFTNDGKRLGTVDYVFSTPAHNVLVVKDGTHEVMVPFNDEFIERLSRKNHTIIIKPIDGLLDDY